jgi:hypothetical protein
MAKVQFSRGEVRLTSRPATNMIVGVKASSTRSWSLQITCRRGHDRGGSGGFCIDIAAADDCSLPRSLVVNI